LDVEIVNARAVILAAGGAIDAIESVPSDALPGHVLVRIRKVRATPPRYPRDPAQRGTA
jgi:hypothetical protein